jgi:formylglycine-generating enzyme required for sulfatase activity
MGSPSTEVGREKQTSTDTGSETQINVRFTNDYYMAVFELTQAQYRRIANGSAECGYTGEDADWHPVEKVTYATLRGNYNNTGPSGEYVNWPKNTYLHEVYSGSIMAKLRGKFASVYEFDLPTEAQWEFACRAKTTTAFNNGKNLESIGRYPSANLENIAWYLNTADGSASGLTTHVVGMKAPNAWGLYDMHGNVAEFCLDAAYFTNINPDGLAELVDPPGITNTKTDSNRVWRGGGATTAAWYSRSGARSQTMQQYCSGTSGMNNTVGVRVIFPVME